MPDLPVHLDLSAPQARVLGCLIEKAATTPDTYPMTLKALRTACNQTSSRHPVVDYEETLVEATLHALKSKGLTRIVHPARGERATKYRHVLDEVLSIDSAELSLLAVLMLRGPQTISELRTRAERIHAFDSTTEVEAVLTALSERPQPLVAAVERQPGQKEQRWIQLLEVDPEGRAAAMPAPTALSARIQTTSSVSEDVISNITARFEELEAQVARLSEAVGDLLPIVKNPEA